jgi:integrase
MQKVWHRTQTGWWYASIKQGGSYRQIKLVKAPKTLDGRRLAEKQLIQELAAKDNVEESGESIGWLTVAHVLNAFLKYSEAEHEPPTARWYRDLLTPLRDMWGKERVAGLRKRHIKAWLKSKAYNPTSANKALGAAKRAFNWAVEEEHIPRNPIVHVRKPKVLLCERTLTAEERHLILASIKDGAFRDFVSALTLTGCRPGEIAHVTASDVDLDNGLWVLKRHKTAKRTGRPRIVYLCAEAVALTKQQLAANRPDRCS